MARDTVPWRWVVVAFVGVVSVLLAGVLFVPLMLTNLALAHVDQGPQVGESYPVDLKVLCGVKYAHFGARWWHATPEQAAPPPQPSSFGDDLPVQYVSGSMTLLDSKHTRFVSTDGKLVANFEAFTGIPPVCA